MVSLAFFLRKDAANARAAPPAPAARPFYRQVEYRCHAASLKNRMRRVVAG